MTITISFYPHHLGIVFADKDGKIVENFKKEIGEFYSKSLRALRKGF